MARKKTARRAAAPCVRDQETSNNEQTHRQWHAAQLLRNALVTRFAAGFFAGTDVAELAFWIDQCGLPGFHDLALDPHTPSFSANANRKVRAGLSLDKIEARMYYANIPTCNAEGERTFESVPFNHVYELLADDFLCDPESWRRTAKESTSKNWRDHHAAREAIEMGADALPFGIFIDAAR